MWKDVTSYGRDDKERKPTTFEAKAGALRIVVTCGHVMYRPKWVMHCYALAIDTHPLDKSANQEQAEAEALQIVSERLADLAQCAAKLMPNVELTGAAAGLSPQRPATEGSEVERRVGPLDGKCGFCGAVAHAGEEWGYTKDLAQQWVLSCPRCCSEAGGAVREIAANGLPGASKW